QRIEAVAGDHRDGARRQVDDARPPVEEDERDGDACDERSLAEAQDRELEDLLHAVRPGGAPRRAGCGCVAAGPPGSALLRHSTPFALSLRWSSMGTSLHSLTGVHVSLPS